MIRKLWLALPLALLACTDLDEIRLRPVVWTGTYQAPFDAMANCMAVRSHALFITATPMIDLQKKRAEVVVYNANSGSMLSQYEFRETAPGTTEVLYRQKYRESPLAADNGANDLLNKCAVSSTPA